MVIDEERTGTWHTYGKIPFDRIQLQYGCNSVGGLYKLASSTPDSSANLRFADCLAVHFPDVAATIDEADFGLLHLEVSALKLATRNAILKRDWATLRAHFAFVDSMLEVAGTELHDAIGVSYLGSLFYGETSLSHSRARTLMPKRLAAALEIMERHYDELA